jgi:hypothetical protein
MRAAERVRDAGFKRWDVHSPFPIHGMDKAMGLGKSWLSGMSLFGGIAGLLTAVALEYYPSAIDYPLVVHGKPYGAMSGPAFVPIMFELTVLLTAFATVFALCVFTQLPKWYHPIFNWDRFIHVTDNGYFLVVEARDPKFSENQTRLFLEGLGGAHITVVHD